MYRYYVVERQISPRINHFMEKFRKLNDAYDYVRERSSDTTAHYPFRIMRITREVVFREKIDG